MSDKLPSSQKAEPQQNHHKDSGARRFLVSIGSLMSARAYLAASQFLVLPFVARQLSVEDFALMALAMVVVVLALTISDAGMGKSLIRAKDADEVEWSSVFWTITAGGLGLALITCALAPLLAWFFETPKLTPLLLVLSSVPFMQAICAAPNAEIEKRENYAGIARVQVISTTLGLGTAVALAYMGAGVWSLVAQQVVIAAARLAGTMMLSQFRPLFTFSTEKLRPHLNFARDTMGVSFLMVGRQQIAIMAISKFLGATPLGYYSMSERFGRLPQFGVAAPVAGVVYVRMSKAQHNLEQLKAIYLSSMRVLAFILIPSMAVGTVAAEPIFTLFLGAEWKPVTPVFTLSIGGLVIESVAFFTIQSLLWVLGRTDLLLRLIVESVVLRAVLIACTIPFGLEAVAASITVWGLLIVPRAWQTAARLVPLRLRECVMTILPAIVVGAFMILVWELLSKLPAFEGDWPQAIAGVLLAAAAPGVCWLVDKAAMKRAIATFRSEPIPAPSAPEPQVGAELKA